MIAAWKALTSPVGRVLIAVLLFAAYSYAVFQEGKSYGALSVVNEQNKSDKKIIEGARGGRDDVDRCFARGMRWDRNTGECT